MNSTQVVGLVQARMGSTRLPGKVLMDIAGKPMLWHVIDRLRCTKLLNKVAVITSSSDPDKEIAAFCKTHAIDCFCGSEDDVLDRYYHASIAYAADAVVRITADCPLIDPEIVDKVINAYRKNDFFCAGASNIVVRTYPRGLDTEIFSLSALQRAWQETKESYQREHVTVYFYEQKNLFPWISITNDKDFSGLRWTVDEPADLEFIRQVYGRLYTGKRIFLMADVLHLITQEPILADINKNILQKKIN